MSPLVAAALLSRPLPAASAVSIIPPAAGLTDASGYRGGVPAHYDPAQGLKAVAVSEAAENYYRRAKDSAQLYAAVETKLGEQRRFVLWWDGQEKASGIRMKGRDAGGEYRASQVDDARTQLSDFGLDRDTIHRWRKRLKDPRKFDEELQRAQERCLMVCEERSSSSAQPWSGEVEWYTPSDVVEDVREVMGVIDLDPASNDTAQQVVRASIYYTAETNGLAQEWQGRVFATRPTRTASSTSSSLSWSRSTRPATCPRPCCWFIPEPTRRGFMRPPVPPLRSASREVGCRSRGRTARATRRP
jgi:hypothetical protein